MGHHHHMTAAVFEERLKKGSYRSKTGAYRALARARNLSSAEKKALKELVAASSIARSPARKPKNAPLPSPLSTPAQPGAEVLNIIREAAKLGGSWVVVARLG